MIQKIYKNTDLLFTINLSDNDNNIINIADVAELSIVFFTDSSSVENHIIITKDDIINDNQIFLDNSKLDLLNEGLLKYNIKLRFNYTSIDEPFDIAKTIETEYFIKNDNFNDSYTSGTVSNTYSKSEIDLKLSLKANESDVFNKSEINSMLLTKANKNELPNIDTLATKDELQSKANKTDVYSKIEIDDKFDDIDFSNYYTKNEVNTKIDTTIAETIDLSQYYKKTETDNKLSSKVDKVTGKQLSTNDFTNAEKAKLASLSNYDDTAIKQSIALKANKSELPNTSILATKDELKLKADAKNVYTKVEVDAKIDDTVAGGEINLNSYYKKNESDARYATKDSITNKQDKLISSVNIKTINNQSLLGTGNITISGSSVEADLSNYYDKREIDSKLSSKVNISDISNMATKTDLAAKANATDVYNKNQTYSKAEVDSLVAGTGDTVTNEVYILRWDETQATEERAALYTKLYNSFWYNKTVDVLFNVVSGSDEYIINVSNIYKDNSATRNEIKLSGSYITSSSIFCVEIILKKDGSFTFTKNNILINKIVNTQLEERIAALESEITNPTSMKVDCLNYE